MIKLRICAYTSIPHLWTAVFGLMLKIRILACTLTLQLATRSSERLFETPCNVDPLHTASIHTHSQVKFSAILLLQLHILPRWYMICTDMHKINDAARWKQKKCLRISRVDQYIRTCLYAYLQTSTLRVVYALLVRYWRERDRPTSQCHLSINWGGPCSGCCLYLLVLVCTILWSKAILFIPWRLLALLCGTYLYRFCFILFKILYLSSPGVSWHSCVVPVCFIVHHIVEKYLFIPWRLLALLCGTCLYWFCLFWNKNWYFSSPGVAWRSLCGTCLCWFCIMFT